MSDTADRSSKRLAAGFAIDCPGDVPAGGHRKQHTKTTFSELLDVFAEEQAKADAGHATETRVDDIAVAVSLAKQPVQAESDGTSSVRFAEIDSHLRQSLRRRRSSLSGASFSSSIHQETAESCISDPSSGGAEQQSASGAVPAAVTAAGAVRGRRSSGSISLPAPLSPSHHVKFHGWADVYETSTGEQEDRRLLSVSPVRSPAGAAAATAVASTAAANAGAGGFSTPPLSPANASTPRVSPVQVAVSASEARPHKLMRRATGWKEQVGSDCSAAASAAATAAGGAAEGPEEDCSSVSEHYNTVFRDWLLTVLDKDDAQAGRGLADVFAAARRRRRAEQYGAYDSADYELCDSKVWHLHKSAVSASTAAHKRSAKKGTEHMIKARRKNRSRLLVVVLGVTVGLVGYSVSMFSRMLVHGKLSRLWLLLDKLESQGAHPSYSFFVTFLVYWCANLAFASVAYAMVYIEPWSAGSGIPEVKSCLNGVNITQILSPKTVLCKVVGIVFALASGLPVGKEGPMIHAGAAIGANVATGRPKYFSNFLSDFRNDRDKRDFAAIGTAAGVASAFRTPIGGVLFALEEGASHWTNELTWRGFAAACIAITFQYLLSNGSTLFTDPLDSQDMFIFGHFSGATDTDFYMWELVLFAAMGAIGGLIGVAFIDLNKKLGAWRRKHLGSPLKRLIELGALVTLASTLTWCLPLLAGKCRDVPVPTKDWSHSGKEAIHHLVQYDCPKGQYNELASLFLVESDHAIKALFHLGQGAFSWYTCFIFYTFFMALECATFGTWMCSGLFVPTLLSGAAFGRGVGVVLSRNPRTYSIMGASAMLGGVTRMLLSLTVILTEASGWVLFVLPFMVIFMTARTVGNHFNDGVYNTQIAVKRIPFLTQEPPESAKQQNLRVHQIMTRGVRCLRPVETVAVVYALLRATDHNCFPVVDRDNRILLGTILRKTLLVLLFHKHYTAGSVEELQDGDAPAAYALPVLPLSTIEQSYPVYPRLSDIEVTSEDARCLIDLSAYVQIGPYTMNEHASAHRAYEMFRTLGLRHLPIVNHFNEVVGMVTRENLLLNTSEFAAQPAVPKKPSSSGV